MENFREFQVDRSLRPRLDAQFKYLQTGISIRHSDSVDVRYILDSGDENSCRRRSFSIHADLATYSGRTSARKISDAWCSRLAVSS